MRQNLFTAERANAALPLVRAIVSEVVSLEREMSTATRTYVELNSRKDRPQIELNQAHRALGRVVDDREHCTSELAQLGIRLGDRASGICDFPAELDGEPIYLCWELGEDRVEFYHDRDSGHADRARLPVPAGVS